jgi:hypothetical protein
VKSRVSSSADRARGRRLYNFIARSAESGEDQFGSLAARASDAFDSDAEDGSSLELPGLADESTTTTVGER